jgi:NADH dehydrogenase FAD-containing subunit
MNILSSKNVMFVQGIAKSIEMEMKVASFTAPGSDTEQKIPYDYLVVATGTKRDFPIVPKASRKQDYLKDADRHIGFLENAGKIVVVGGGSFHPYQGQHISWSLFWWKGAVGIEWAADLKLRFPAKHVVLVHSRYELLSTESLPTEFKSTALELLEATGVEVILGRRWVSQEQLAAAGDNIIVRLSDGEDIVCGELIFTASPHTPRTDFLPRAALNEHGEVKVLLT